MLALFPLVASRTSPPAVVFQQRGCSSGSAPRAIPRPRPFRRCTASSRCRTAVHRGGHSVSQTRALTRPRCKPCQSSGVSARAYFWLGAACDNNSITAVGSFWLCTFPTWLRLPSSLRAVGMNSSWRVELKEGPRKMTSQREVAGGGVEQQDRNVVTGSQRMHRHQVAANQANPEAFGAKATPYSSSRMCT